MPTDRPQRIAVVLPVHNEAGVVGSVVARIPRSIDGIPLTPLVVDDGSTDSTGAIARAAGALVLRHVTNLGVGAATRTGFAAALDLGADLIVTMDADDQHDPSDIESLVRPAIDKKLDVVIGNRLIHPEGMPLSRIMANWLLNGITLLVYGGSVSDSQSGFKCLTADAVRKMDLRADRYDICSEIVGEIFSKKLRYGSVAVKPVYTTYSQAKGQHFLNGVNIVLQLLVRMMRRV